MICAKGSPAIEFPTAIPYLCERSLGHTGDHTATLPDGLVSWRQEPQDEAPVVVFRAALERIANMIGSQPADTLPLLAADAWVIARQALVEVDTREGDLTA